MINHELEVSAWVMGTIALGVPSKLVYSIMSNYKGLSWQQIHRELIDQKKFVSVFKDAVMKSNSAYQHFQPGQLYLLMQKAAKQTARTMAAGAMKTAWTLIKKKASLGESISAERMLGSILGE